MKGDVKRPPRGRAHAAVKVPEAGHCHCGKVRYLTRKAAKRMARVLSRTELNAYECDGYWHLGHLPGSVRKGKVGREHLPTSRRPA